MLFFLGTCVSSNSNVNFPDYLIFIVLYKLKALIKNLAFLVIYIKLIINIFKVSKESTISPDMALENAAIGPQLFTCLFWTYFLTFKF